MNFLVHQIVAGQQVTGRHFRHCYIYEGQHCSCGGNYQGDQPGPDIRALTDTPTSRQEQP